LASSYKESAVATYTADPAHSHIDFSVRHLMISKVRGAFESFSISLNVPDEAELPSSVSAEVETASIDTRVADRDNHLRSADFFDAANYPKLTFASREISGSASSFTISGDLTLRGITKPVTLKAEFEGSGKDPWGNDRVAYSASTKINRKDFGLNWNQALETGGVMVGEEIDIAIQIEAVKAKEPATV
jgi:polyisoprenoid-binding protein YceI